MKYKIKFIQHQLSKLKNNINVENVIIVLGILFIMPFILISFFNNPGSGDFNFFSRTIDLGFWNAQLIWYSGWTGRYFSTALLSLYSLLTKSFFLYKLIPIILIIFLFYSIYNISRLLFGNFYRREAVILTFCIVVVYLLSMPTVAEGFYWLSGAITYQVPNILTIFLLGFIIKLLNSNKIKYLVLSIVFSFFIIGTNELSMLYIIYFTGIIFIYQYAICKKYYSSILILFLFELAFAIIVFNSPGNEIRAEKYVNKHLVLYSIVKTLSAMKSYLGIWLPIILIMIFIFHDTSFKKIHLKCYRFFEVNPLFLFAIVISIPFIGFFITYWSIGFLPPLRAINTIFLFFILGLLYLTFVLGFRLRKTEKDFITFSPWVKYFLTIIILIHFGQTNNIRTAYSELISGRAYHYDLELKERYKFINKNKSEIIEVPKLKNIPKTIFNDDIKDDSVNWRNKCYQDFFNKKSIIIK